MSATISAVIVNYHAAELAVGCARSLRADGVDDIVVVDNGSGDGCAALLADGDPEATFVALPINRGYGAAVNAGVRHTSGDVVVISNADITVEPGTIPALTTALAADPGLGVVGPRIVRPDGTRYPSARAFPSLVDSIGHGFVGLLSTRNPWSGRYLRTGAEDDRPVDWVSGAFSMVRREAFDTVGGFDESYFMFMEDVDLCRRLHGAGWGVAYEPAGQVMHVEGVSRASAPYRMILAHHRSLARYAWRYGTTRDRILMPLVAAGLGVRACIMCARTAAQRAGSGGGPSSTVVPRG